MNIRDNVEVCGYCGSEIRQRPANTPAGRGAPAPSRGAAIPKPARQAPAPAVEPDEGEEEEGGLAKILQDGEQVLIGSLNVSVKKFLFHAYLTNKRIFLIDTQEKKLKVTAKDIPVETIAGSIVEFSENSDPVLVLSIKSADDEIKTMKLVFVQDGMDRSAEIDDWIGLLHEEQQPKKSPRAPVREPSEPEAEPEEPPLKAAPVQRQELQPARKPIKEHEKQPPVKRLITISRTPESPQEEEPKPAPPKRRVQVRMVEEPAPKKTEPITFTRGIPTPGRTEDRSVKKPEVQAAVKSAMKGTMQPVRQPGYYPSRKPVIEPVKRQLPMPEPVKEVEREDTPTASKTIPREEAAEGPRFCQNCGKKIPGEANFCPGCGTKLAYPKAAPSPGTTAAPRPAPGGSPHRKVPKIEEVDEDDEEKELQKKPPVRKAPKGSDMTILHKFLRR
jgi:hypothetical protein